MALIGGDDGSSASAPKNSGGRCSVLGRELVVFVRVDGDGGEV